MNAGVINVVKFRFSITEQHSNDDEDSKHKHEDNFPPDATMQGILHCACCTIPGTSCIVRHAHSSCRL